MTDFSINGGWLSPVRRLPSPNCDERPENCPVELLVIHGISLPPGEFGGPWIDALFTNTLDGVVHPYFREIESVEVSAHLLVRRDGEVVQYVPFDRRAWHAGQSCFDGRERCNDYSIGIELEGSDEQPYEEVQYQVLAQVCKALFASYPSLSPQRIVGHCDIAPCRKTDPGPYFEWPRLRGLLATRS